MECLLYKREGERDKEMLRRMKPEGGRGNGREREAEEEEEER